MAKVASIELLFYGFDEVWCFSGEICPDNIPLILTSDQPIYQQPNDLIRTTYEWMLRYDVGFGCGDGIGINVISPHLDIFNGVVNELGINAENQRKCIIC